MAKPADQPFGMQFSRITIADLQRRGINSWADLAATSMSERHLVHGWGAGAERRFQDRLNDLTSHTPI